MKKLKNLLLIALFSVCSFALVGTVNAAESIASDSLFVRNGGNTGPRMIDMVCEPETLEKDGDQSTCYLIGVLKSATAGGMTSVNGFATQVYTTQHLRLTGANINDGIGSSKVGTYMTEASEVSSGSATGAADAPSSLENYKCLRGATIDKGGNPVDPTDYRCAVFYTKKSQSENAYTLASLQLGHKVSTSLKPTFNGGSGIGVIGSYTVMLEAKETVKECGEICFNVWEIPTASDYDNSTCVGGSDDENCKAVRSDYACHEVSLKYTKPEEPNEPDPDPETPNTGAFTSYAVLAAGALIAIGAIAMAKKNSKFNRI